MTTDAGAGVGATVGRGVGGGVGRAVGATVGRAVATKLGCGALVGAAVGAGVTWVVEVVDVVVAAAVVCGAIATGAAVGWSPVVVEYAPLPQAAIAVVAVRSTAARSVRGTEIPSMESLSCAAGASPTPWCNRASMGTAGGYALTITGVPIGAHEYSHDITARGMWTQPWLAPIPFSLPGPS
jgi:hypothetical protein